MFAVHAVNWRRSKTETKADNKELLHGLADLPLIYVWTGSRRTLQHTNCCQME